VAESVPREGDEDTELLGVAERGVTSEDPEGVAFPDPDQVPVEHMLKDGEGVLLKHREKLAVPLKEGEAVTLAQLLTLVLTLEDALKLTWPPPPCSRESSKKRENISPPLLPVIGGSGVDNMETRGKTNISNGMNITVALACSRKGKK